MKLERIDIRRLPGIDEPFSVEDLAPGLNVVIGPNASGKSSLCRAVRATMWPNRVGEERVELISRFRDGEHTLRAVAAETVVWERDGRRCDPPVLPGGHLAHCYTLGLRDLLDDASAGDSALADQLRVHMAGGFDLHAAAASLQRSRQHGKREADALAEADRGLQVLDAERRRLAGDDDRLAMLRKQLGEADASERELAVLAAARDRARRVLELEATRARLAARPAALAVLHGRELEEWDEWLRDEAAVRDELAHAQERIDSGEAECRGCRLTDGPVEESTLRAWLERVRGLADLERQLDDARRAVAQARESLQRSERALEGTSGARLSGNLEESALDALDAWVEESAGLSGRRHALEARLLATPEAAPDDLDLLHSAAGRLRDWLAASGDSPLARLGAGVVPRIIAISAFAAGVALCLTLHAAWAALAGAAVAVAATVGWATRTIGVESREISERYATLAVPQPSEWVVASVRERLTQIEVDLRHCERARELAGERDGLQAQLSSLAAWEAKLVERREELADRLGIDPGASPLRASDLATRLRAWRGARAEAESTEFQVETLARDAALRAESLRDFLESVGEVAAAAPGDASQREAQAPRIRAALESLRDRCERWRRAEERADMGRRDRITRQRRLRELEARRGALLRRLGLGLDAPGDEIDVGEARARLVAWLDEWPSYRADRESEAQQAQRLEELSAVLSDRPDLLLLGGDDLAGAIDKATHRAQTRSALAHEIGGIEARVCEALGGDARERAAAEVAIAEEALTQSLEDLLLAEASRFLLDDVEAEHDATARPEVLRRAASGFASFTHHHFALEMSRDEGGTRFRAVETRSGRVHELEQLSDGTRMQLLLAVRLAFATAVEAGPPLPLFLDEALTASDPGRFDAVAEGLLALARGGRQLFYLTCDPADVARWREVARAHGEAEPHVVDLAACRKLGGTPSAAEVAASSLRVESTPPLPAPDGMSAVEYAAVLAVGRPDPQRPPSSLHLFHALRGDLPLLYRLLADARVDSLGHWRALAKTGQCERFVSENERRRLDALCELLEAALENWRIGRGLPIDRQVLADAGLTDSRLEGLTALAADLQGDARRFVEVLESGKHARVKGMRHDKRRELTAALEATGVLVRTPMLDVAEIRIRALARVAEAIDSGALGWDEAEQRVTELLDLLDSA